MTTSHTAGPWKWRIIESSNQHALYKPNDALFALIIPLRIHKKIMEENMRLMAAAPDLLKALRKIENAGPSSIASVYEQIARAAIAKATNAP